MEKITANHPLSQSADLIKKNLETLKILFPSIVREGKIDIDELKALLGEELENNEEYYRFTWAEKSKARQEANKPSTGTLRPVKEESKDWNTTQNIFIEGDNLEVLKLLQKSYSNKIKVIYIDPPYNTGKDFVYKDNYFDNLGNYLAITRQTDEEGRRLSTNSESDGRYHSNWLNMMYPRLKLARNILTDEGIIFISVDDNELYNLRKICDETLGEENWVGTIIWKNATDNNPTQIAIEHEYLIVYAKNKSLLENEWKSKISDVKDVLIKIGNELVSKYKDGGELKTQYNLWYRDHKNELWPLDRYKYIDSGGVYTGSQSVHNPGKEGYRYDVIHPITGKPCKQPLMGYRFAKTTMDDLIKEGKILFGDDDTKIIELKLYANEYSEKLSSIIEFDGRIGSYDLKELFPDSKRLFTNPKPVKFINEFIPFVLKENDTILDFYAGSGTTAHAVFLLNSEDGGNRKFILVQFQEPTDPGSEAFKSGYKVISEITKERIRRAGEKVKSEVKEDLFAKDSKALDIGFRVYKLDSSNINAWDGDIKNLEQNLLAAAENIKQDRTEEDVLYEILLKAGLDLAQSIEEKSIANKKVFNIGVGALFICLANDLTTSVAEGIGKWKAELAPATCRVIFKDTGFNDVEKTNSVQILKRYGITEVNTI